MKRADYDNRVAKIRPRIYRLWTKRNKNSEAQKIEIRIIQPIFRRFC